MATPKSRPTLNRAAILAIKPAVSDPIEVPEFGGTVHLRVMDGKQRERFEQAYAEGGRTDLRASLLAATLASADGALLFTEADIPAINALPAPALMRLYDRALELNKVTEEQVDELQGN